MTPISPRGRTLSDSMDYDDELAELHDKRERQLRMANSGPAGPSGMGLGDIRFVRDIPVQDSDEDTEDASEDGDMRIDEEHLDIKEQLYHDKLGLLKANLEELDAGNHTEFTRQLSKIEQEHKSRRELNAADYDTMRAGIERDYSNERLLIVREFEEKKIELRETLINDLEEKKRTIEMERFTMELQSDLAEPKPMSTRKLRRRPNEPIPMPEKRRKTPQSQITFLLEDKAIDDDMKLLSKKKIIDGAFGPYKKCKSKSKKTNHNSSTSSASEQSDLTQESQDQVHLDTKIEDGKLFYEKRWFHRGQPVFVEGKDLPRTSGVISGISQDLVWVRKLNEQNKINVPMSALQKGKLVIKRRA